MFVDVRSRSSACVLPVFHGGNTGSSPVGRANLSQQLGQSPSQTHRSPSSYVIRNKSIRLCSRLKRRQPPLSRRAAARTDARSIGLPPRIVPFCDAHTQPMRASAAPHTAPARRGIRTGNRSRRGHCRGPTPARMSAHGRPTDHRRAPRPGRDPAITGVAIERAGRGRADPWPVAERSRGALRSPAGRVRA